MIHRQQLIPLQQSTRDHIQLQRFDQNSIFRHSPKRKISKPNPNPGFEIFVQSTPESATIKFKSSNKKI